MNFVQPLMLAALPLIALPIIIHLINQWRYQTKQWGAMMFLLAANRMNRGFAKLRQWLILAMRTLAVFGLIFAVARPLASGLLGLSGGAKADTTMVLMDRSPSMQQNGLGGVSKIETGRRQVADALTKLGSNSWVTVDSATGKATAFESVEALSDSAALAPSSTTTDMPSMLQSSLDYLQNNKAGPTEIWICSDLRESDWQPNSPTWPVMREGFQNLPQSVRFHLLAYANSAKSNVSVRVTDVRREVTTLNGVSENALLLSMQFTRSGDVADDAKKEIPLQIEIEGVRTEIPIELNGRQTDIRNERVILPATQEKGWGKISIPADENNADNDYYFVFADEPARRVVVVSEDRAATRALEIAAGISASGDTTAVVDVVTPDQLDSLVLDDSALLLWQTSLPDATTKPAVQNYVDAGGQVIFFPPASLSSGAGATGSQSYGGISWDAWKSQKKVMVESWRGDQDLLAATESGVGLPVGQLEIQGYASIKGETELSNLASLTGGEPLLAKVPTTKGGVYFFTASADPKASTLAESGIVLFVAIQRAIEQGQIALGNTTQREAGPSDETTAEWRRIVGELEVLSTEFSVHGGVYQVEDQLFAINRSTAEDRSELVQDKELEALFAGLQFARVDDSAGNLSGIVREIWRLFLILMIFALILEALLCIPRVIPRRQPTTA